MRPPRRGLSPLERRKEPAAARALPSEIIPEIRIRFPHFEAELRRDYGLGFEIFPETPSGATSLLYVLAGLARQEFHRRLRFVASHLTVSESQAERFAIQQEGLGGEDHPVRRTEGAQEDQVAGATRIPS